MANTKAPETENDLREEFNELRAQMNDLMQALKEKSEEKAEKLGKKLESGVEHYQEKAEKKLHDAYEAGDASLNELNDRIRKNPIGSLLIAFSIGYAIFKVLGNDK